MYIIVVIRLNSVHMYIVLSRSLECGLMSDVYRSLVDYVVQDLKDGTFKLSWGIVAIVELTPRVIVRFTV